jgi:hypothetical protein
LSIEYVIQTERRRVVATVRGTMAHDDVVSYQRDVWSQPKVTGFDEIVDMTHVEHVELPAPSGERMKTLVDLSAEMDPAAASKFAIVAPGDFAFGLARMYATYRAMDQRSTKEVRVFRSMNDAVAWLDG